MNKEKQKIVKYLYPTKELRGLMCNDVYQELLEMIDVESCISDDNLDDLVREQNLGFVRGVIKGFVATNKAYQQILFKHYKHQNIDSIVYDILIGLVLYISSIIDEFSEVDILKDRRSICYGQVFILELV